MTPASRRKMTEDDLKAIMGAYIQQAVGYVGSEVQDARRKALDYYHGEPFGNEMEGRSQVISTEVRDTIEWIMPSLLRIFTSGDKVVAFEPVGPEDEQGAEQETDYVNHVVMKDNPGFQILHDWFKDALLQKNGIVKAWWDTEKDEDKESYEGLTDEEFALLLQDEEIEPTEHTQREDGLHDVTVMRTKSTGRIHIENVPPEEFLISPRAKSIKTAPFVGHRSRKTASELILEGYSKEVVDGLPSWNDASDNAEETSRFSKDEDEVGRHSVLDDSMREIWVTECFVRIDYDGDGIAELRKVCVAGNYASEILENDEVDKTPLYSITPIMMPHKFFGVSLSEIVEEIQQIKSVLWRNALDNMYFANLGRYEIAEPGIGENTIEDLLTARPGGVVRTRVPGMLTALQTPLLGDSAFKMLEYADTVKENRTGVTRYNQGLDANSLNKTATGVQQIQAAAMQRIELIARVFSETGVKDMFLAVHELSRKHSQKARTIRLRNEWTPIDPREWKKRADMTVQVGLGTGNRDQQMAMMGHVIELQMKFAEMGAPLVQPKNMYHAATKFAELAGYRQPEQFFSDPEKQPPQEPPPDPRMIEAQANIQAKQAETQAKVQGKQQELAANLKMKEAEVQGNMAIKQQESQANMALQQQKAGLEHERGMFEIASRPQEKRPAE